MLVRIGLDDRLSGLLRFLLQANGIRTVALRRRHVEIQNENPNKTKFNHWIPKFLGDGAGILGAGILVAIIAHRKSFDICWGISGFLRSTAAYAYV